MPESEEFLCGFRKNPLGLQVHFYILAVLLNNEELSLKEQSLSDLNASEWEHLCKYTQD